MFQYATGRRLAHHHSADLALDVRALTKSRSRSYALAPFAISSRLATQEEIQQATVPSLLKRIAARLAKEIPKARGHIEEVTLGFDPRILRLSDDVYLDGYWQCEKYFRDISELIRDEFQVTQDLAGKNLSISEEITASDSISVHVRRGDYVTNSRTNAIHGLCGVEYYHQAVQLVVRHMADPTVFVFSDDPAWAKANLRFDYPMVFVDHNGPDAAHEDLRLMTLCKHHVTANSSLSWWGAWLSASEDKVIVAPKIWFTSMDWNDADVVPESWVRL